MRLYSRTGAASVGNDDHGDFEVDPEDGSVEVPHEFGLVLLNTFHDGEPAWEDDPQRAARLEAEDLARRRDPATLYDLLQKQASPDAEAIQAAIDAAVADALAKERAARGGDRPANADGDESDLDGEEGLEDDPGEDQPAAPAKAAAKKAAPRKRAPAKAAARS